MRNAALLFAAGVAAYVASRAFSRTENVTYVAADNQTYTEDSPVDVPNILNPAPVASNNPLPKEYQAFLYAIRRSENKADDVATNADFYTYVGGSRFTNDADHPVNTGEKLPIRREDLSPRFAGDTRVTTAAGAFQITKTTWDVVRKGEGVYASDNIGFLPDFTPQSQMQAATRLLRALSGFDGALMSGDIGMAFFIAHRTWESLPGNALATKTFDDVASYYFEGLSNVA